MCQGCCAAPHDPLCSLQANEMLLGGRKLTAQEACGKGLVSQVFWPGTFTQEVMVRIKELASCNPAVCAMSVPTSLQQFQLEWPHGGWSLAWCGGLCMFHTSHR